jgi:hypothetical protein
VTGASPRPQRGGRLEPPIRGRLAVSQPARAPFFGDETEEPSVIGWMPAGGGLLPRPGRPPARVPDYARGGGAAGGRDPSVVGVAPPRLAPDQRPQIRPAGTVTPTASGFSGSRRLEPVGPGPAQRPPPAPPRGRGAHLKAPHPALAGSPRGAPLPPPDLRLRGASSITKVVSAFPRLNRFRVPPGACIRRPLRLARVAVSRAGAYGRGRSDSASMSVAGASNSAPAGGSARVGVARECQDAMPRASNGAG